MAPFYGWGSTASRLEPLQGGSLLFTTKFPGPRRETLTKSVILAHKQGLIYPGSRRESNDFFKCENKPSARGSGANCPPPPPPKKKKLQNDNFLRY